MSILLLPILYYFHNIDGALPRWIELRLMKFFLCAHLIKQDPEKFFLLFYEDDANGEDVPIKQRLSTKLLEVEHFSLNFVCQVCGDEIKVLVQLTTLDWTICCIYHMIP